MQPTTLGLRRFLAACLIAAACPTPSAFAVDPTPRQSEAIYSELARHPEFKAADDALNGSYRQRTKGADPAAAGRVKEEQRQWLKAMQSAVFNAAPGERLRLAIRMTQERTLALLENAAPVAPAPQQRPASPKAAGSSAVEEGLRKTSLGLSPSSSGGDLAEFQKNLFGAIQAFEKDAEDFFTDDECPPLVSERAALLLVASQNYLKAVPSAGTRGAQNDFEEKLSMLHRFVIRNAPEKKKAEAQETEAYQRLEKKDFKGAADCYRKAIQMLEQMELRLGTDMDVYVYFVKKSPPGSTFTDLANAQWKAADYAGVIETAQKAMAVGKRISKEEGIGWVGEAQLLGAKALFKLKRNAEAEATAKEAVRLLDSVEYGNLREAKALLASIQKGRR